jgi:signal transduction histidine kinase
MPTRVIAMSSETFLPTSTVDASAPRSPVSHAAPLWDTPLNRFFAGFLDSLLTSSLRLDTGARVRARLFLISHLLGPFLGFTVILYLWMLDPHAGFRLAIPAAAFAGFWGFPVALRLGARFWLLALLSVQNLTHIILFVSYFYGGLSSPFLPWLIVALLLAVFYLADDATLRAVAFGLMLADLLAFYAIAIAAGGFPSRVPFADLAPAGMVSLICAGAYAAIMALSHARILSSRSELEREVQRHRQTSAMLLEAKDAAEGANRAKTEFLATMGHELRTPLNAVIGFSEIIMSEALGPLGHATYLGYAKDIHDSGRHLLDIINDILDITKAEAGTLELSESPVDCRDLIGAAVSLVRPRAEKAGLDLTVRQPDRLPQLRADLRMAKQILLHLLVNAVKFTPSGGRVTLDVTTDERGLAIEVSDTGIGMANADLERVLLPFVQVDSSLSRRHEGAGLGLPLAAAMIKLHGGIFELSSAAGKGTVARAIFPAMRLLWPEAAPEAPSAMPRLADPPIPAMAFPPASSVASARILVVEDDGDLRALLQRILERAGFKVLAACHGKAALDTLRSEAVDLVITDMLMPEMDGVELMRILKRDRPALPIIAVSGVEEWRDYQRIATRLGAKAALRKPVTRKDLTRAVNDVLSPSR